MIEYRAIRKDEIQMAVDLCKQSGLEFPIPYEIAFGAFEDNRLVGICVLRKVYQIEPLISFSKHASTPQILAEKVMACASLVTNEVSALVRNKAYLSEYQRYGFKIRDENITSIYKEL